MQTDQETVNTVLAGHAEAFAVLVQKYNNQMMARALAITGDRDVAEDVVQETMISAFYKLHQCKGSFFSWATRILINRACDWKNNRNQMKRDILTDDMVAPTIAPDTEVERRELITNLSQFIGALPEDTRRAFVMHHIEGRELDEVSKAIGLPLGATKMRLLRARQRLQNQLKRVA